MGPQFVINALELPVCKTGVFKWHYLQQVSKLKGQADYCYFFNLQVVCKSENVMKELLKVMKENNQ